MCFVNFLVTILQKKKLKIARFLYWVLACSQKCQGYFNFFTSISCFQLDLAKLSYGVFAISATSQKWKKKKKPCGPNLQII
jgi:hypothetical protein